MVTERLVRTNQHAVVKRRRCGWEEWGKHNPALVRVQIVRDNVTPATRPNNDGDDGDYTSCTQAVDG